MGTDIISVKLFGDARMKKRNAKLYIYAFLTFFVMAAIFYLSAQDENVSSGMSEGFLETLIGRFFGKILPSLTNEGVYHDIRKYAHIFEYFCLGVTSCLFFCELILKSLVSASVSTVFCLLYACSDEWHQTFVPGRSGQISDVCVDFIGIAIGVLAETLLCAAKKKNKSGV